MTLSQSGLKDNFISFYNSLRMQQGAHSQIIGYGSMKWRSVMEAVVKDIGLFFKSQNTDFFIFPCKTLGPDIWVMEPRGEHNIDIVNTDKAKFQKHSISWLYLDLSDDKYYWQLKPPWNGCPFCKSEGFKLVLGNEFMPDFRINIDRKVITQFQKLDDQALSQILSTLNDYKLVCGECREVNRVADVAGKYYLKIIGNS